MTNAAFSGSPKAISRSASNIDVFLVGENGHLEWVPVSQGIGNPLTDLGTVFGRPHHTPVGIASWASNRLDLFATTEVSVVHRVWNGSWASNYDRRPEVGTDPSGSPTVVSWGPNRIDAFVVTRSNQILHSVWNGSGWFGDSVMATDALGDAVVISRGTNSLDLFYEGTDLSLKHLAWTGSSWFNQGSVTAGSEVQ